MHINRLAELDRRAVRESLRLLGTSPDLGAPSPCAGWTLGDLLAHLTAQHRGFAAAVRGAVTRREDWAPVPLAADPVADYALACTEVDAAFSAVSDDRAPVRLPEIRDQPVPAGLAISFHLVDYVVHSWDVAVSRGLSVELDEDVLAAALAVAEQVPDGPERVRPGAAFAPGSPPPESAGGLPRILLLLGRDPAWRR